MNEVIRARVEEKKNLLDNWRAKAIQLYGETATKKPVPLSDMEKRKANSLWQDERFWIQASLSALDAKDIHCYTGCNKCGKSATSQLGTKFVCDRCHAKDATTEKRDLINAVAYDKTGSLKITAYTNEVELIVGHKVNAIAALQQSANQEAYAKKVADLRKKEMLLQIAPANELFISNALKWIVRAVEVPAEED